MARIITINILRFIVLVPLQVLILDNINLGGSINPYLYILFVLLLPFETPKWLLLILSFLIGILVDVFAGTPGMHAASTVFLAYLRPVVIANIQTNKEFEPGMQPSISDLGFRWFFFYTLVLVFVHHLCLFTLEVFRFSGIINTIARASYSTIFTLFLVVLSQYLFRRSTSKRK
ncbi:MAG: rod shape-determining protein MreD [Bacteroidales bacterium]|nr:rod shape-determining protein MreD [Bacteroidales bacterium]